MPRHNIWGDRRGCTLLPPGGDAYEYATDGRFHFHVDLGHPLTGLIVRYRGWLASPAEPQREP